MINFSNKTSSKICNSLALKYYRLPWCRSKRNNKPYKSYWQLNNCNNKLVLMWTIRQILIFLRNSSYRCIVNYSYWLLKLWQQTAIIWWMARIQTKRSLDYFNQTSTLIFQLRLINRFRKKREKMIC